MQIQDILEQVACEVSRAQSQHAPMNGEHEGYAVILEEVDELWAEVKKKGPNHQLMKKEALHIAAMAVRFIHDLGL